MSKKAWIAIIAVAVTVVVTLWFTLQPDEKSQKGATIRIGALLPLTGDAAPYGNFTKEGILVGVDKANELLKARSMRLEVVFEDSRGNPKDGLSAAQKLIEVDKVSAIVDDAVSGVTLAVVPVCDSKQVVLLSTGSTSPKLSGISKYFFRIWNSDAEEGQFTADYVVRELKPRKVAILYINNEYGVGLRQVFSDTLAKANVSIAASESFAEGATDLRGQLVKIAVSKPDAVYLIAYPKEAKLALKQAKQLALQTTWMGTVVMLEPEMPKLLTDLSYTMHFPKPQAPGKESPAVQEFQERFRRMYSKDPPVLADVGYDGTVLIAMALARGASDGSSIRTALADAGPVDLASGTIKFDGNGDVHKPMVMQKLP